MVIRKGDPIDIATKGLLSGDSLSIATEGFLETEAVVSDIITGGAGGVVITVVAEATGGIDSSGGSATIIITVNAIATGGIIISGAADVISNLGKKTRGGKGTPGRKREERQNLATIYKYLGGSRYPAVGISGFAQAEFAPYIPIFTMWPELAQQAKHIKEATYEEISAFEYVATGGINLTGESAYNFTFIETAIFEYEATGSIEITGEATIDDNIIESTILEYVATGGIELAGIADVYNIDIAYNNKLDEEFIINIYLDINAPIIEQTDNAEYSLEEIIAMDDEFMLNYLLAGDPVPTQTQESLNAQTIMQYIEDSVLLYDMSNEKRLLVLEEAQNTVRINKLTNANDIDDEIFALYEIL